MPMMKDWGPEELDAISDLRSGVSYCQARKDYVNRDLVDEILRSDEEWVD